jgi:hypothetical protein
MLKMGLETGPLQLSKRGDHAPWVARTDELQVLNKALQEVIKATSAVFSSNLEALDGEKGQ